MFAKVRLPTRNSQKRNYSSSGQTFKTELFDFHVKHGGQMVPFAGWEMPVSYKDLGTVDSHLHTRTNASIFDVSHMLQLKIVGKDREEFMERVLVADVQALKAQTGAYSLMLNQSGGIIDDVIVSRYEDHIYFVSNAGCADKDFAHLQNEANNFKSKGKEVIFERIGGSLIALQGPKAGAALSKFLGEDFVKQIYFMNGRNNVSVAGVSGCRITRCGYTGEDGFEIGVTKEGKVDEVVSALLQNNEVKLAGLAARDSLRLEAGLALYGNDLNESISPIEAALLWPVSKRRRENPTFIGGERFAKELKEGVNVKKIGLIGKAGRIPRHDNLISTTPDGSNIVGTVSSGGFSPCLKVPIAMAYVDKTKIEGNPETFYAVQGAGKSPIPLTVTKMPFVKTNYYHAPKN